MSQSSSFSRSSLSRRSFLTGVGALAAVPLLAACSTGGGSGKAVGTLKFWDMPWGVASYNAAVKKLSGAYKPASGLPPTSYQIIQWNNFSQTFTSAIAAKKGPAVSTGGAFQAFQFAEQGAVTYADHLLDSLKKTSVYDDFLPGTVAAMSTKNGYVGIPWQIDQRTIWYRKSLLEKAGVEPPTDWDSWITAGKALKKIGAIGFGIGAGAGENLGYQALVSVLINNGGGLFDKDGNPDAVTDRNIESMDFIRELAGQGIIDPHSVSYTIANVNAQWSSNVFAIGYNTPGLDQSLGDTTGDLLVMSPPSGPHGDKGSLYYVNNLMMYTETPSQEGSEAFLTYYVEHLKDLWTQNVVPQLPALKSITESAAFQKNANNVKVIKEWQPISKPLSALSKESFSALASVDAGQAVTQWAQTMFAGQTDSKAALTTLQAGLEAVAKK